MFDCRMNTRTCTLILIAGFVGVMHRNLAAAENPSFTAAAEIRTIERILPAGWKIVERHDGAVPRGLVNRETGFYLKLHGREKLYASVLENGVPTTVTAGVEEIELWIMPPDFRAKKPNVLQKGWPLAIYPSYTASEASNAQFKLFGDCTVTPSWQTWGKDIYRALNLVPSGYEKLFVH